MSTAQRCRSPSTPAIVYYFGSVLLLNAILRSAPVSVATDLVVVIDEKEQKKQKEKNASLQHCEGHCVSGADCANGLKCVNPDDKGVKFEEILKKFGCEGEIEKDASYCIDPSGKIVAAKELREQSRRWVDMINMSHHNAKLKEDGETTRRAAMARERNPFRFTDAPTSSPTTMSPTESPTREEYPVNMPPLNAPEDYFDYSVGPFDVSAMSFMKKLFSNPRGPTAWGSLGDAASTREGRYWSEFAEYFQPEKGEGHDTVTNVCATGTRQSPIDVTHEMATSQCFEYHEIRHRSGDFGVHHPLVEKQILPSKLRLHYPREYFVDPDIPFGEQRGE